MLNALSVPARVPVHCVLQAMDLFLPISNKMHQRLLWRRGSNLGTYTLVGMLPSRGNGRLANYSSKDVNGYCVTISLE